MNLVFVILTVAISWSAFGSDAETIARARGKLSRYHDVKEIFRQPETKRSSFFRPTTFRDLGSATLLRVKNSISGYQRISDVQLAFNSYGDNSFFYASPRNQIQLEVGDIIRVISIDEGQDRVIVRGKFEDRWVTTSSEQKLYTLNYVKLSRDGRQTTQMGTVNAVASANNPVEEFDQYDRDLHSHAYPFIAKEARAGAFISFASSFTYKGVNIPANAIAVILSVRKEHIPWTFAYRYYTRNYFFDCPESLRSRGCILELKDENFNPNHFRGQLIPR